MKTSNIALCATMLCTQLTTARDAQAAEKVPQADGQRRDNVIFILLDDAGYGDFGCYGQSKIATPNIDAMAARGVRFTNMYAGAPVSAPSRCTLLTGLHSGHAQIRYAVRYC